MEIRLKHGVRVLGIQPEMAMSMIIAAEVFRQYDCPFVVTSVTDGEHMVGSLHYAGMAIDIRAPEVWGEEIAVLLVDHLGSQFDVVFEGDHIHIEYDPRKE